MPTYTWTPSADTDDYELERSIDNGLNWTTIVSIPHDYDGANYNSATGLFFYEDVAPVLGEIVRLYGTNADGAGPASFFYGQETTTTTCRVYGSLVHQVTGEPLRGVEVRIQATDRPNSTLRPGSATPSVTANSLLGGKREFRTFSDDDGKWSMDLVRGITVRAQIPEVGFDQGFKVPEDRDILNITDAYLYRSEARMSGSQKQSWARGPKFVP